MNQRRTFAIKYDSVCRMKKKFSHEEHLCVGDNKWKEDNRWRCEREEEDPEDLIFLSQSCRALR